MKLIWRFQGFFFKSIVWWIVEPWNVQKPHLCKHIALKCAKTHICANTAPSNVQICKNTSTTNVQTWPLTPSNVQRFIFYVKCATFHRCANHCFHQESTTFVQTFYPQMCKQPHLCKHGTLKCANQPLMSKSLFSSRISLLKNGGGGLTFGGGHKESQHFMFADQWLGGGGKKSSSFTKADPKEKKSPHILFSFST